MQGYNGDTISESEWDAAERDAMERDADREMFGDEPEQYGLEDIGCK